MEPRHGNIIQRLTRIEGQIRGIRNMIEENRECEDIMIQLSAVSAGLTSVAKLFVSDHVRHCVAQGLEQGNTEEVLDELEKVIHQFAKMK